MMKETDDNPLFTFDWLLCAFELWSHLIASSVKVRESVLDVHERDNQPVISTNCDEYLEIELDYDLFWYVI